TSSTWPPTPSAPTTGASSARSSARGPRCRRCPCDCAPGASMATPSTTPGPSRRTTSWAPCGGTTCGSSSRRARRRNGPLAGAGAAATKDDKVAPHLEEVDLGERLLGDNVLHAAVVNPGPAASFSLRWEFTSPSGKASRYQTPALMIPAGGRVPVALPYTLT